MSYTSGSSNAVVGAYAGRYATGSSTLLWDMKQERWNNLLLIVQVSIMLLWDIKLLSGFTTREGNIILAIPTGNDITTGGNNVFIGKHSGDLVTTGTNNVVVGSGALGSVDGLERENVGIGFGAVVV